jgi:hypothetical protein
MIRNEVLRTAAIASFFVCQLELESKMRVFSLAIAVCGLAALTFASNATNSTRLSAGKSSSCHLETAADGHQLHRTYSTIRCPFRTQDGMKRTKWSGSTITDLGRFASLLGTRQVCCIETKATMLRMQKLL